MEQIILAIPYILIILFSVVIHEVSHGLAANAMGDDTAKIQGRLTLNPISHLDFFGSLLLPALTFFLGGFIFGYAKPVPYNPRNLNDRKYGPAKVALAGPLSNFTIAILFGLALRFIPGVLAGTAIPQLFIFIVWINIILAIFNLMPVPPLDGHWLVLTLVPDRFRQFKQMYLQYGLVLFFVFLFFVFPLILPLVNLIFKVITGAKVGLF